MQITGLIGTRFSTQLVDRLEVTPQQRQGSSVQSHRALAIISRDLIFADGLINLDGIN